VNLGVAKAGKDPMKQSKSAVLTCAMIYALFLHVMNVMLRHYASCSEALLTCTSHGKCLLHDNSG
jgi:hypothetical protein